MKIKKIIFCTLRDNKGATGGPGGVLFLQKEIIGQNLGQYKCEYWFNRYREDKKNASKLNRLFFILKALFKFKVFFITHDVKSAYILARLHKKYSLIYHHQGPLVEEYINLGMKLNEKIKERLSLYERDGFSKAVSIHFPSSGAEDMYFLSEKATLSRSEVRVGKPLFNIILPTTVYKTDNFELYEDNEKMTFFSLGTLTIAKGQDQVVAFLSDFLNFYKGAIRYIIVGKGPLKSQLENALKEVADKFPNFEFYMIESVPHSTVMYLHEISDIYIMMHRISIFDFATLEAMSKGCAIVLSRVGGNTDFNKENNIVFTDDASKDMASFAKTDFNLLKEKNLNVFNKYFSVDAFRQQYESFAQEIINFI